MRYISYAKQVATLVFSLLTHLDCRHLYVVPVVSSKMAGHFIVYAAYCITM